MRMRSLVLGPVAARMLLQPLLMTGLMVACAPDGVRRAVDGTGGAGGQEGGQAGGKASGGTGGSRSGGTGGGGKGGSSTGGGGGTSQSGGSGGVSAGAGGSGTGGLPLTGGSGGSGGSGGGAGGDSGGSGGGQAGAGGAQADAGVSMDAPPIMPMQGLVLRFPFDESEGATAHDLSGNGNDGALKARYSGGKLPSFEAGRFGNAIRFGDSANYVEVPPSASLDALSARFSIAVWCKPDASGWMAFVARWAGTTTEQMIQLGTTGGGAVPNRLEFSAFDSNAGRKSVADSTTLPGTQWIHLAATYDGSDLRLYRDGLEIASAAAVVMPTASARALFIGMLERADANGAPELTKAFKGLLDELYIFNRALSAAEVMMLMATPSAAL